MKVAVISPYYKEEESMILRCIESVRAQTHDTAVHHILVSDGHPHPNHQAWGVQHISIPNCGDYGDTPRAVGSAIVACQDYDAIAWLDVDNWYEPDHIQEALKYLSPQKPIVTTGRILRRTDGTLLASCPESDGINFCDTNCYVIHREAFGIIGKWTFKPKRFGIVGDRIFWSSLPKQYVARSPKYTVNYTTKFAVHYLHFKETPPPDAIEFVNGPDGLPIPQKYYK